MHIIMDISLLMVLLQPLSSTNISSLFNFQGFPNETHLNEGESQALGGSLIYSLKNDTFSQETFFINCLFDYSKVGLLKNWTDLEFSVHSINLTQFNFTINLYAKRLGSAYLECQLKSNDNLKIVYKQKISKLIVIRQDTVVELVFRILITIFVLIITFVMGCGIDRLEVFKYIKKPISPAIGFCSQFVFMPLLSAGLAKLYGIDGAFGLGLLTIGCSPGGGSSNVWTVIFGGDLNLSMTMTFISSCAALVMMPLWLFILSRIFVDPTLIKIPFDNIAYNLLMVVIPVLLGILFRWKFESKAAKIMKWAKVIGLFFVVFILTFGIYANFYIFQLMADYVYLLPVGASLPWVGFSLGYLLSLVTRRTKKQSIAISLETGFQNVGIAIIILKYSIPQPEGDLGAVMSVIVSIFTPIPLYVLYLIIFIKKRYFTKEKLEYEAAQVELT
uniref:Slc10a-3 n=1 Tax=Schmidtea mediterranea TaxID=79327 RepID=A0A0H3YEZ4_SCHMD|nr:slc10a-3 [Schmidtea mediterranea]